jgi:hypothetical protein
VALRQMGMNCSMRMALLLRLSGADKRIAMCEVHERNTSPCRADYSCYFVLVEHRH